jgi:hypothetical protein
MECLGINAGSCTMRLAHDGAPYASMSPQADAKQSILLSPGTAYRGYQPIGANVTRYDGGAAFVRDWHEAIDLFKEVDPTALQVCGCVGVGVGVCRGQCQHWASACSLRFLRRP